MRVIEEMVSMRDGVRLYTRRVLPEEGKKFPIVFIRTPYDKENVFPCDEKYEDNSYIVNGFAIVYQHVRGTAASEGKCIPYVNERNDGLDTLEYIRSLPEYNGQIYATGGAILQQHILRIWIPIHRISRLYICRCKRTVCIQGTIQTESAACVVTMVGWRI